jgi:hypothetical protein
MLAVWMALRAHGWHTIRTAVKSNVEVTRMLERLLAERGFRVFEGGELSSRTHNGMSSVLFKLTSHVRTQVGYSITSVGEETPQFNSLQSAGSLQYNYQKLWPTSQLTSDTISQPKRDGDIISTEKSLSSDRPLRVISTQTMLPSHCSGLSDRARLQPCVDIMTDDQADTFIVPGRFSMLFHARRDYIRIDLRIMSHPNGDDSKELQALSSADSGKHPAKSAPAAHQYIRQFSSREAAEWD